MKYSLAAVEKGNYVLRDSYLLSKNDLCSLELIPDLAHSGIKALKIEGRMKTPEYVGIVTKIYRHYLDLFYKNPGSYSVDKDDVSKIKQIFSREIGTGYYRNGYPEKIISLKKSGSIGNFLGRVIKIAGDHIHIKSNLKINKGDYL